MTSDLLVSTLAPGEDEMHQYLSEIRQYPLLTPQQEQELAQRCALGDEEAIRQMVGSNLRLVVSVARKYAGRGVPLMDLIQEGSIGLLAAAKKFDHTLQFRFSTYATKWIRQGISRCLINHSLIRVPAHTADQIRKVTVAQSQWLQETGELPTEQQLAERCGMTVSRLRQLLQLHPEICSLDAPAGEKDDGSLGLLLENLQAEQPYEGLVREELNQTMEALLGELNDRQRQVLRLHFGMEDGVCYSLEQIGAQLGISKERVRQIERQAMDKLQKLGSSMGLEDFLE